MSYILFLGFIPWCVFTSHAAALDRPDMRGCGLLCTVHKVVHCLLYTELHCHGAHIDRHSLGDVTPVRTIDRQKEREREREDVKAQTKRKLSLLTRRDLTFPEFAVAHRVVRNGRRHSWGRT